MTDGEQTHGDAVAATRQAIGNGIDSINTVGLPGADTSLLASIATVGKGNFVDGTDLSNLIDGFISTVLSKTETFTRLDILDVNGNVLLANVTVGNDGQFSVPLLVSVGENIFQAHATSSLGNVDVATLRIHGVPEPSPLAMIAISVLPFTVRRSQRFKSSEFLNLN